MEHTDKKIKFTGKDLSDSLYELMLTMAVIALQSKKLKKHKKEM